MSKIRELAEIVREIPNGAEIAFGGFIITRNAMAFAAELIRQGKKDLDLYSVMGTMECDLLVGAGAAKRYSYGGGSLDRFGKLSRVNEAIVTKSIVINEYSALTLGLRMHAGALGIPFIPSKVFIGTDMYEAIKEDTAAMQMGVSPFDGEPYLFLAALQPEYSVIHANAVDDKGNVIIEGPTWDFETAKAGKKLIVTAEKLVSTEYVKRFPEKVTIPGIYTYAAAIVPVGAYPGATYKVHDHDAEALTMYAKANQRQDTFDEFLNTYILGTKDHNGFIEKMGGLAKMQSIAAEPVYGFAWKEDGV
ncbi:MAG: hypothetical protein FWF83_02570 [Clostridiales bacterium]|nr:hypothetical protein [Clostridiales bacterium]